MLTRRDWLTRSAAAGALWSISAFDNLLAQSEATTADTAYGRIRGLRVNGLHVFKGVPYGGPTEGAGRFMPPTAPHAWTGVREATTAGPRAIQRNFNGFMSAVIGDYMSGGRPDREAMTREEESENCLNLNVLTSSLTGRRAVMVYIHGGGFALGSGVLTAISDRFVRENDVVLVGINHRLNMFGYLYLGGASEKYADSGNAGQLDLVLALRWVRDNISRFGGDPGNVTVFGESGGGAKVSALLAMPSAKGLVHRAIIESGSALRAGDKEAAARAGAEALRKIGLTEQTVDQVATMPLERLRTASPGGGAIMDGRSIPVQTWDPAAPAQSADIPMIIGYCKDEPTFGSRQQDALFTLDASGLRTRVVEAGIPADAADRLLSLYKRDYPTESPSDLYFRIMTDRGTGERAITQAERKAAQNAAVYAYYFAWNTPILDGTKALKAFHTAELPLAMRLVKYAESEPLSKQIAGAWAAFAKSGNPNHAGLPNWPKFDSRTQATMTFDLPSRVVNNRNSEQRALLKGYPGGNV